MTTTERSDRPVTDEHLEAVARAEAALLDPAVEHIVEMVLRRVGDDTYEAAAIDGRVRVRRHPDGHGWSFEELEVSGRNPLGDQHTDRFSPLAEELAVRYPSRTQNAYPFAYEQLAQLFDHPAAPDLVAVHTAAHNWEDHGGHRGEHGSIDVVQARAPFVLAGAGVRRLGMVHRACRLVDVAPTVLALLGAKPRPGVALNGGARDDALLARQDGEPLLELIDPSSPAPEHVVGFLLDGTNANVLYDLVARGEAPNIARLMEMGTTFAHGAMSSLPTVTLPNHTTILTGTYPGHHGILHNAWWDRSKRLQLVTNSPATWVTAMETLEPGVETLFQAVKRAFPGSVAVSINEPCDTGADYSIFDLMRRGEPIDRPPPVEELPHTSQMFVRPVKEYRWSSLIDHTATEQFLGIWSGSHRGVSWPLPPLHLGEPLSDRRGLPRRWAVLGDRRGERARHRRPHRRDPRRGRACGGVRADRLLPRRRPRDGRDRSGVHRQLGRRARRERRPVPGRGVRLRVRAPLTRGWSRGVTTAPPVTGGSRGLRWQTVQMRERGDTSGERMETLGRPVRPAGAGGVR